MHEESFKEANTNLGNIFNDSHADLNSAATLKQKSSHVMKKSKTMCIKLSFNKCFWYYVHTRKKYDMAYMYLFRKIILSTGLHKILSVQRHNEILQISLVVWKNVCINTPLLAMASCQRRAESLLYKLTLEDLVSPLQNSYYTLT